MSSLTNNTADTSHVEACPLTFDDVVELLGLPAGHPPNLVVRSARRLDARLPQLVLSAARAAGHRLGSGGLDELRRNELRAALYTKIASAVARDRWAASVVKGPALAPLYPAGVLRPVGDLDLVVDDEVTLWQVAALAASMFEVQDIELALFVDDGTRHIALALTTPADDPWMEADVRVEISTFAYAGDFAAVPVRASPPPDDRIANILAIAEERFQRPFGPKDICDVRQILGREDVDVDAMARSAIEFRLAPELAELVDAADDHVPAARAGALLAALERPAAEERALRDHWRATAAAATPAADCASSQEHLDAGDLLQALLLSRFPTAPETTVADLRHVDGQLVLLAPIGQFLLVSGAEVDIEDYRSAQRACEQLVAGVTG